MPETNPHSSEFFKMPNAPVVASTTEAMLGNLKERFSLDALKHRLESTDSVWMLALLAFVKGYTDQKKENNSEPGTDSPPDNNPPENTRPSEPFPPVGIASPPDSSGSLKRTENPSLSQDFRPMIGRRVRNAKERKFLRDEKTIKGEVKALMNDPHRTVCIGDSICHGFQMKLARLWNNRSPSFVGEDGLTTGRILGRMRENKDKFTNKELAILGGGGNDIDLPVGVTMGNFREMIKLLHEQKVKEVVIYTRFPPGELEWQYDKNDSPGEKRRKKRRWEKGKKRAMDLRDAMLAENWGLGLNMSEHKMKIHVVDLNGHFSTTNGYLEASARDPNGDKLHPRGGYEDALNIIANTLSMDEE